MQSLKKKRTLKKEDLESSSEESCDELRMIRQSTGWSSWPKEFSRGNTNHSWRWTPISPCPVANRTRSRIKE